MNRLASTRPAQQRRALRLFSVTGLLGVASVASALLASPALAQERVMRERDVSERSLVEALTPPQAASAPDDGIRTRSFRPAVRPAATAAATASTGAAASQAGRASILVTFVTDRADLTGPAKGALDVLAAAMKSERLAGVRFTIEGHADPRGGDEYNLRLSQARAESVRAYLISQHGLEAGRIDAVGKGSANLLNKTNIAAPENRRVTIVSQAK
ncbi:MAG: OmpA family protein [Rubrivivax sp.]|nr:OmpA family protein [Rubrivivax sp.]